MRTTCPPPVILRALLFHPSTCINLSLQLRYAASELSLIRPCIEDAEISSENRVVGVGYHNGV